MEIKYCAKCQCRVSSVDISDGYGVKFGGKYYCEECVIKYKIREQIDSALQKKKAGTGPTMAVKPVQPPSTPVQEAHEALEPLEKDEEAAAPPAAALPAKKPATRWEATPGVDDLLNAGAEETDEDKRTLRRKKSPMPMILVIVGVIVLVALMAAVILKKPSTGFQKKTYLKPQTPYSGGPLRVPGKIEAEEYDKGGDGVAYSDSDLMNHGKIIGITFRADEAVDMQKCGDAGGGLCVSLIEKDEWLEYTIYVPNDGTYDFNLRVNSPGYDIILQLFINEKPVSELKGWNALPDPDSWSTATIPGIPLSSGEQVLRVKSGGTGWNLNWIEITKSE